MEELIRLTELFVSLLGDMFLYFGKNGKGAILEHNMSPIL